MKRIALIGLMVMATWACKSSKGDPTNDVADGQCAAGQTVLYSKVTPPSAGEDGASGIADAPSVLGGGASQSGSGATTGAPVDTTPYASTATSCVPAVCPAGQVAVPKEHPTSSGGSTGAAVSPPASGAAESSGVASGSSESGAPASGIPTTGGGVAVAGGADTPTPGGASTSPPTTISASDVICTAPPPACEEGESPSFAPAGFWHCMPLCDANNSDLVVISYGGIYGNGGVCAPPPPQTACPTNGQVWTWDFLDEAWACEVECDNGQYDQHTYGNQIVCVPC